MLKGVPAIISPDLLAILAQMGHGDELVISDAHFPAYSVNPNVVRVDAATSPELLKAILKLIELDQYVDKPVMMMAPVPGDNLDQELMAEVKEHLGKDAKIKSRCRKTVYAANGPNANERDKTNR